MTLEKISNSVRKSIINQVNTARSGHPGGALSCADILITIYYNFTHKLTLKISLKLHLKIHLKLNKNGTRNQRLFRTRYKH